MYNIIPLIVILLCLGIILAIIFKKFSFLSTFDVSKNPKEKELETKDKLINERLKRKAKFVWNKLSPFTKLASNIGVRKIKSWQEKLKNLEEKYKKKPQKEVLMTKEEFYNLEQNINNLLKQAEKLIDQEEYGDAEKKYIEIISYDPKNVEAYRGLGNLYILQNNYSEAKQIFEHILKLNKLDDQAYAKLGKIAEEEGNLILAKEDIQKSLNLKTTGLHYFELAEVCLKLGEIENVDVNLMKALELEPNNPKYLDFLIKICIIKKDKTGAKEALARLRTVNPENGKIIEFEEQIRHM
jgi:tetratricopeptide (TPR) repeat protein